jgi:hypothetical protein
MGPNVPYEEWVKQILDLRLLVDAGEIYGPQREGLKEAITAILIEGLMPAHLDVKEIRELATSGKPIMEQWQPYEDLARKLWKTYKELMQNAVRLMDFDIDFLFQDDVKFRNGLAAFRRANPELNDNFEKLPEWARSGWQNDLSKFRNSVLEHQGGDRKDFGWFYEPENAEALFNVVWRTIAGQLPMLLELRLGDGIRLIEQDPDDRAPRWPQRFQYHVPGIGN